MNSTLPTILPLRIDDDLLMALSSSNPHLKIERSKKGELIVMSPSGTRVSNFQSELIFALGLWKRNENMNGRIFDSQAGFRLPDGSILSPDVSWISEERWNTLSEEEQTGFAPLCPDFVIEVISPSDSEKQQLEKMKDWMNNGVKLAWLIDPGNTKIWVFRANSSLPQYFNTFDVELSGETILPEFLLNLSIL